MKMRFFTAILLAFCFLLAGCKVTLYSGLPESEANQMLALLMISRIDATKVLEKDNTLSLTVDKSQFLNAVETLRQAGFPRQKHATVLDVFPENQLVSSPEQERAKMNYIKEQQLEAMLSNMDGVISARVSVGSQVPENVLDGEGKPTVAVLIKYSPTINLSAYQGQIRDLVKQAIASSSDQNISVVMVPAAYRYVQPPKAHLTTLSTANSWGATFKNPVVIGGIVALLLALIAVSVGFTLWRSKP